MKVWPQHCHFPNVNKILSKEQKVIKPFVPQKYGFTAKELMLKIKEMEKAMKKLSDHHAQELGKLKNSI